MSDTSYGQVNFEWAIVNDPDSERFTSTKPTKPNFFLPDLNQKHSEEIRAMQAGLAPGQVRRGLHKFQEVTHLVDTLLSKLEDRMIHGDPYAYHNAIELERLGYFYTQRERDDVGDQQRVPARRKAPEKIGRINPFPSAWHGEDHSREELGDS